MKEKLSLNIGLKEFVFLAALLDGDGLLGVEDPFQDSLAHHVEEEWERLSPLMEEAKYIKKTADGDIEVEPDIAKIVRTCCFPVSCIILTVWKDERFASTYAYYVTNEMTIQKADIEPFVSCNLTVLPKTSSIIDSLTAVLSINGNICNESCGGEVPAALIESVKKTYESEAKNTSTEFVKQCPNFIKPELFLDDLLKPASYSILVMTDLSQDDAQTTGFSLLKGEERLWKIRAFARDDGDWLEISTCCKEDLGQELNKLGRKVKEIVNSKIERKF
jgi:hypothetical protein